MRRTRIDVICSILTALENGPLRPTPLMSKANLPSNLFKRYLTRLVDAGLLKSSVRKGSTFYALTDEGREYVREYRRFLKFSAGFRL